MQAYKPSPILLDYAQTKACLAIFTKSLAKQVAKRGIRVNAVAHGPYWTVLQSSGGQPDEKVKQFGKDTPMGRPGQPVEIAPLYVTWHPMPAHIPPDRCGALTAGMVWSKPPGIPTRASARRYFPGQPLRLYTGPSPPGCGNFSFLHSVTLAACYDVRPPLCANHGPDATPEDDR